MSLGFMELRRLGYFVAVVEQRSFRAAALKLHLSQPPLTRQIQLLEQSLGVQLLRRGPVGAEPTPAGELFYRDARNLLAMAQQAVDRVQLAGRGKLGRLDVGVFGSAVLGAIPRIVRSFREQHPEVDVALHSMDRAAQVKALRERRIDAGFNRFFTQEPGLTWEVIQTERMVVVLPAQHPLAARARLSLEEIGREQLILYPRAPRPGFIDQIMRLFHQRGIAPHVSQEVDDMVTAVGLVGSGIGISLVTESGSNLQVPGTVQRPLRTADSAQVDLCLISRDGDDSPLLTAFLQAARSAGSRKAAGRKRTVKAAAPRSR